MAAAYGGDCYLRFDDTNPEAEKQVRHSSMEHCSIGTAWAQRLERAALGTALGTRWGTAWGMPLSRGPGP